MSLVLQLSLVVTFSTERCQSQIDRSRCCSGHFPHRFQCGCLDSHRRCGCEMALSLEYQHSGLHIRIEVKNRDSFFPCFISSVLSFSPGMELMLITLPPLTTQFESWYDYSTSRSAALFTVACGRWRKERVQSLWVSSFPWGTALSLSSLVFWFLLEFMPLRTAHPRFKMLEDM